MTETTAEQAAVLKVEHGSIFEALAAAQAEFKAPTKTKKAAYGMYADLAEILAAVRPALNAHGIYLFQKVTSDGVNVSVETVLGYKTGEVLSSGVLTMPVCARAPLPLPLRVSARRAPTPAATAFRPSSGSRLTTTTTATTSTTASRSLSRRAGATRRPPRRLPQSPPQVPLRRRLPPRLRNRSKEPIPIPQRLRPQRLRRQAEEPSLTRSGSRAS